MKALLKRKRGKSKPPAPVPPRYRTWKGKVVEVAHEIRHVNAALIDASLDRRLAAVVVFNNMLNQLNPVLGSGKCRVKSFRVVSQVQAFCMWPSPSKRTSAWHALRLHHRCRLLRGSEASCERIGSFLHSNWNDQEEVAPSVAVSRAHLIGCLGSERDQALVEQVAQVLRHANLNPMRQNSSDLAQIMEHHLILKESGRLYEVDGEFKSFLGTDVDMPSSSSALRKSCAQHRASSIPSSLPPELLHVVTGSPTACFDMLSSL